MLRIGGSLSGVDLTAQFQLQRNFSELAQTSQRLATLKRINSGKDDPAGLIALETLKAELVSLEQASKAADRARSVVRVADSALSQTGNLLNSIRGNILEAASSTTSPQQREALQIEIDAALEALDRIGADAPFGSELTFLTGPDPSDTASLNLPQINSAALGGAEGSLNDLRSGGSASLDSGNFSQAIAILDSAQSSLFSARARVGAFEKYTIDTSQAVLNDSIVNISSAISRIGDADVALESANLVRSQILVESGINSVKLTGSRVDAARALLGGAFSTLA